MNTIYTIFYIVSTIAITTAIAGFIYFIIFVEVPRAKLYKKINFVQKELYSLWSIHSSRFCDYKLIPGDYEDIINKGKDRNITTTKEEIDNIYRKFLKE